MQVRLFQRMARIIEKIKEGRMGERVTRFREWESSLV